MADLITELQTKALDTKIPVCDLLRIAKVVSVKLGLDEFRAWIESELNGYDADDVPSYRVLTGELKAYDPYHGPLPVMFPTNEWAQLAKTVKLHQKISEIEMVAAQDQQLYIPFSDEQQKLLREMFRQNVEFKLIFSPITMAGVVDAVRNVILDWSLQLEKNGIKGEGMSFSKEDKAKAQSPGVIYKIDRIENFTGNMGPVSDHAVINATHNANPDFSAISDLIMKLRDSAGQFGLSEKQINELESSLTDLKSELSQPQPSPSKLGQLLGMTKTIIQSAGSSLLVQGAVFEIDKLRHLFR